MKKKIDRKKTSPITDDSSHPIQHIFTFVPTSIMITKYFANVLVKFNPFSNAGKSARLFLSRVPTGTKIDCKVLTKPSDIQEIKVTFKDKHVMTANPATMRLADLSEYFDIHSRKLAIKDSIQD